jgi:hypothetical protein
MLQVRCFTAAYFLQTDVEKNGLGLDQNRGLVAALSDETNASLFDIAVWTGS